jgi:L-seryl-tRNA(Ser) seleniumtransferase
MRAVGEACVDMAELQAGASRLIARLTGAQAGIVTSGAAAAILLGAAACLTGLDSARMNRLPEVADGRREFLVLRSQRNTYDRGLTIAGGRIVEIGMPDRLSGSGVRDAAAWEIAAAVGPATAGIYYLVQGDAALGLPEVAAVARGHGLPLIVDAAAALPPSANLRRLLAEGADLVAFSGGKAIGGPPASGILCGRADLVGSALIQTLDLDIDPAAWRPPASFSVLEGVPLPHHGIGRACKAGKQEVIGLMVAIERFAAESDAERQQRWTAFLEGIATAAGEPAGLTLRIMADPGWPELPALAVTSGDPRRLIAGLAAGEPAIAARRHANLVLLSPLALAREDAMAIGQRLRTLAS